MTAWENTCLPLQVKEHWCKTDKCISICFQIVPMENGP